MNDTTHTQPDNGIDWALVIRTTAKLLAVAALVWAGLKVHWASEAYGWMVAPFLYAGIHLPMCAFATLYTVWFLDIYTKTGTVAVILSILSAWLI
jgi:hypothetical protein